VGAMMIPLYARRFREQLPDATLSIVNHLSATLYDQMRAKRLDFAIFHNAPPTPSLAINPLGNDPLYLIGPKPVGPHATTIKFVALDQLPLVMPSRLHAVRGPVELKAASLGIRLNIVLEVDILESLFQLVADGEGHTIATRNALFGRRRALTLVSQRITTPNLH